MDDATLRKANEILIRFVSDVDAKVRYALKQRDEYHAARARGETLKTYRTEYIMGLTYGVFGWLAEKAEEFSKMYPQDRITTEDLKDILATAAQHLRDYQKKG